MLRVLALSTYSTRRCAFDCVRCSIDKTTALPDLRVAGSTLSRELEANRVQQRSWRSLPVRHPNARAWSLPVAWWEVSADVAESAVRIVALSRTINPERFIMPGSICMREHAISL